MSVLQNWSLKKAMNYVIVLFADKIQNLAPTILQQPIQFFSLLRWSTPINFFNDYLPGLALEHAKSNLSVPM